MLNYALTVRDKLSGNQAVMLQIANNTAEQALLGDLPRAIDDAVMGSHDVHKALMMQYLSSPVVAQSFAKIVFDLLQTPRTLF